MLIPPTTMAHYPAKAHADSEKLLTVATATKYLEKLNAGTHAKFGKHRNRTGFLSLDHMLNLESGKPSS